MSNSDKLNTIAMGVLSAALFAFGGKVAVDILSTQPHAHTPGWVLPISKGGGDTAAAAVFSVAPTLALLPKANADAGEDTFKKCAACHTNNKGGENKVGPNLYNIVGRPVAKVAGFAYSDAMKAKGGAWTWDALATYLHNPREAIPDNKMAFAGVDDDTDLADLLAYLRKNADQPADLPK